jgi:hypothetical protein
MALKNKILLILLMWGSQLSAQNFISELNGFKLGQYRDVLQNELGSPILQGKYDDGFIYEGYLIKPDSSLYLIAEYAPGRPDEIWSLQVTGSDTSARLGVGSLKIGMSKAQVERLLGKPGKKIDVGEYGSRWEYDNTNYSIEINRKGKFSSIKIKNISDQIFPQDKSSDFPTLEKVQKVLINGTNKEIMAVLCGNTEVYADGNTYFFKKSFATEQATDFSGVIALIRKLSADLATVNPKDLSACDVNLRVQEGDNPKVVFKFKPGHRIREIVFRYFEGRYEIFEITASDTK